MIRKSRSLVEGVGRWSRVCHCNWACVTIVEASKEGKKQAKAPRTKGGTEATQEKETGRDSGREGNEGEKRSENAKMNCR